MNDAHNIDISELINDYNSQEDRYGFKSAFSYGSNKFY